MPPSEAGYQQARKQQTGRLAGAGRGRLRGRGIWDEKKQRFVWYISGVEGDIPLMRFVSRP